MSKTIPFLLAVAIGLSACATSELTRTATGAVAGGLLAAATDNDPTTGALIGGVGGALCDDVTPELCPY